MCTVDVVIFQAQVLQPPAKSALQANHLGLAKSTSKNTWQGLSQSLVCCGKDGVGQEAEHMQAGLRLQALSEEGPQLLLNCLHQLL